MHLQFWIFYFSLDNFSKKNIKYHKKNNLNNNILHTYTNIFQIPMVKIETLKIIYHLKLNRI
jgi:hypothetical protein